MLDSLALSLAQPIVSMFNDSSYAAVIKGLFAIITLTDYERPEVHEHTTGTVDICYVILPVIYNQTSPSCAHVQHMYSL